MDAIATLFSHWPGPILGGLCVTLWATAVGMPGVVTICAVRHSLGGRALYRHVARHMTVCSVIMTVLAFITGTGLGLWHSQMSAMIETIGTLRTVNNVLSSNITGHVLIDMLRADALVPCAALTGGTLLMSLLTLMLTRNGARSGVIACTSLLWTLCHAALVWFTLAWVWVSHNPATQQASGVQQDAFSLALRTLHEPTVWAILSLFTLFAFACGAGMGLLWLMVRRNTDDFGRDYYAFAAHANAGIALIASLGVTLMLSAALFLLPPLLPFVPALPPHMRILCFAALALLGVAELVWLSMRISAHPMRFKAGMSFAALCMALLGSSPLWATLIAHMQA